MIRFGTTENDLIVETQENDIIWGLAGADIIASNAGNDELYGNPGNDVLLGGTGADRIWGGLDDDLIVGNPQEDYANGNLGNDTVHGGQGDDCVRGGQGNDWVAGDRGNDILYGDLGDNTLVGGPGQDIFVLGSGEDVILDFTPGQDRVGLAPGVTFDSLQVSQQGEDSVVSDRATGAIIGIFQGIDATSLESSQFTSTLLNIPTPSPLPSLPDIPSSSPAPAPSLSILPPAAEVTSIETDPGNTLETASSISLASNTRTFSQSVGGSDVADYYKFSLGATNTFELSLTGLTALATVDVLDEQGNVVLNGQLSNNTSVISGELPGGQYRLRVTSDAPTNYLLNTRITPQLPGITITASDVPIQTTTSESLPLMKVDTFRADNRFKAPDGSTIDGSGYTVVVLDTGINKDHPAFGGRIVYSEDFGDNDTDASDVDGHGSHVSSIIASSDSTYPGVAPGVDIIHLKVFRDDGKGNFGMTEKALNWVIANADSYANTKPIVSVNMSLGQTLDTNGDDIADIGANYQPGDTLPDLGLDEKLKILRDKGIIVVSSSGNDFYENNSTPGVGYPAADPNSLSIGAVYDATYNSPIGLYEDLNENGTIELDELQDDKAAASYTAKPDDITAFSQRHPDLTTVFAPGGFVHGANPTGTQFNPQSGTSQAAPHVAGMVALAQQLAQQTIGRLLTPDEFEQMLKDTGDTIFDGDDGDDTTFDEDDNVTSTNASYQRVNMFALAEAILQMAPATAPMANSDTLSSGLVATVTGTSGDDSLPDQANQSNTVPITINTADILANDSPNNNLVVEEVSNPFGHSVTLSGDTISFIPNILYPGVFDYTVKDTTTNQTSNLARVILNFDLNLDGLAGNDLLVGGVLGRDTIQGGDGNDSIFAGTGGVYTDDTVGGSDTVIGGRDDDSIFGGNGDDYLDVDASLVNSIIPASDDAVQGNDTVRGGYGNDTIGRLGSAVGATGVDYYDGGEGNDSIQGGNQGANTVGDTLIGGGGNDTIEAGGQGDDSVLGGDGDDVITIGGGNDFADSGNGNDSILAIGGNNTILTGDGDDSVITNAGTHYIDFGAGNDNAVFEAFTIATINAGDGNDFVSGGLSSTIAGGAGNDTFYGGVLDDSIRGGSDDDYLSGGFGDGNDTISGDDGNDFIEGVDGNDSILGGNGQDTIEGGFGSDTLSGFDGSSGGDGTDRFVFNFAELLGPGNTQIQYPPNIGFPFSLFPYKLANLPASLSPSEADFITDFDPNQDEIEIVRQTYSVIDYWDSVDPQDIVFGRQINLSSTNSLVGHLNLTPITGGTLLYLERDKLNGFTDGVDGDIAVATFLGLNPGDFTAANFIGTITGGPTTSIEVVKVT
ncbi:S8 family serine peptidase [Roseofilum sp. Guam]|uniref:S8 family serine peptidase n=1 Tax=Roseofilum sp. Guam TaxID=2821502 RepID=UPI001B0BC9C1|nr:S8 family serine peptidase [Roseofilum sp. Guam]MBP0030081.1 S8 family serine peptidase [Roseofilum sp. Guam]